MGAEAARAEVVMQAAAAPGSQISTPGPSENVDRIREILFGSQMREYGQRFAQMEERFLRETGELKAEVRRRLDSLEAYTRQEVESLADRLKTERSERAESADRISREFTESVKALEKRLLQSDEQVSKDLRELRQSTLDRQRSLSDEFTQAIASTETLQNRRLEELRASAVDRFALANFLTEVALRLRGEFRVPGVEDPSDVGANR
jgi:hypothetical protein